PPTVKTRRTCVRVPCANRSLTLSSPHTHHVTDPHRKKNLVRAYKAQMNKKPCRYFTYQEGDEEASFQSCPFGTSCFYAHLKHDGTPLTPPRLRTRMGEEGRVEVVQEVKLSDFLTQGRG
ncbi:putative e3 ubiquitin-protein ligase makorin-2, partial [Nannochloropsis gaditana]